MANPPFLQAMLRAERDMFEIVFPGGRNPSCTWDGTHFALPRHPSRPLSVSRVEARFLANFVTLLNARSVLEIGTGFGYSTAWLAHGITLCDDPDLVYTVDDSSEGLAGDDAREAAGELWNRTGVSTRVNRIAGTSPHILQKVPRLGADLAFIDGGHHHGQPLLDYHAVRPHLSEFGCIIFHDVQAKYDVPQAVETAGIDGFLCVELGTSCEMVAAVRTEMQRTLCLAALSTARRGATFSEA